MSSALKKVSAVGGTAAGAVIGTVVAGPIGTAIGAGVGAGLDLWRHHKAGKAHPLAAMTSISTPPAATPPARTPPRIVLRAPAPVVKAVAAAAPPGTALQTVASLVQAAPAVAPPEATALQSYFDRYPYDQTLGDVFWKSTHTGFLTNAFQLAFNKSLESATLGQLPTDGIFGPKTSTALSLYTHKTVAPDPKAT